jgi:glycosyltransferase involved in cell wall biosynthesis
MDMTFIKNVLIVTSEPFPNGMAGTNRIISLGKGFMTNYIDVQILSMYKFGEPADKVINPIKGVYEGIKFSNIYNTTVKSPYKIMRAIHEFSKSVLVFHYCLRNLKTKTLILYYSHESLPALAIKFVTYFSDSLFYKEETEHPLIRVRDEKLNKYLFLNYHYRIFDGMFVITHNLYKYFKDELKYKKPILILPMIVDVDRFTNGISINSRNIVFSGELNDKKEGLNLLIRAFSKVLKLNPNYNLNLYGNATDDAYESYLIKMIFDLKIQKNVIMHGYKIRDEMTEILRKADILVFTRPLSLQATYGFSTKLGEYLAAGKPVVATRIGEIENYLKDRKNAFICDPNEDSIANKICEIIEDYSFASRVAEEGRQCALEHFNNKEETKKAIARLQDIHNKTIRD